MPRFRFVTLKLIRKPIFIPAHFLLELYLRALRVLRGCSLSVTLFSTL